MERAEKALLAVPLLALAVWRFIRYMQFGARVHRMRRPVPAEWPVGISNSGEQPGGPRTSVKGSSATVRAVAAVAAVAVWIVGNVILYIGLFQLPFERDLPFIWPLFVAIFANFYLIPFAGRAGRKWAQRFEPDSALTG